MRITTIINKQNYSSNAYLIRSNFNNLESKNVLIDTGGDDTLVQKIKTINTGVGKKPVDIIILTHNHFDHTGGVKSLKAAFNPLVYAFSPSALVDRTVKNGDIVFAGDTGLQVIHTPGHSHDSICLWGWEDKILFSGDTPVAVVSKNGSYSEEFVDSLKTLNNLNVSTIYPGHGEPIYDGSSIIRESFETVRGGQLETVSGIQYTKRTL